MTAALCVIALALPTVILAAFALVMWAAHQHDFKGEK